MDAYKIGVSIALTNNVSGALRFIGRDIVGLGRAVDGLQGKFSRLNLAIGGGIAVAAGVGFLDIFKNLAKAGGAVIDAQNKMLQLGISQRDVAIETAAAYAGIGVAGTTIASNLDNLRLLRGVLGDLPSANAALAGFNKAQFVLNADGYGASQLDMILKAMDIQGAFVNKQTGQLDPAKFNAAISMAIASVLTTGGLLNGQGFYQATRLMGPAATAQSVKGFLGSVTEILASMGNRGARGLQDGASLLLGGNMSGAQVALFERMHLLDPSRVRYTGGGRYLSDTSKMLGGSLLANGDIVGWLHSYFLPAAAAAGMSPLQAGSTLNKPLAGVISFIASNWPQIVRSQQQQDQAQGVDQYALTVGQLNWNGATQNLSAALTGLWQALGTPAAVIAVPLLNKLTSSIRSFTDWVGGHQAAVAVAEKVMGGLGVALVALGTVAIAAAIAGMVGSGGTLVLLAGALGGLGLASHAIPGAVTAAEKALQRLAYDLLHPLAFIAGTAGTPASHPGMVWRNGPHGGGWFPISGPAAGSDPGSEAALLKAINDTQNKMLKAMSDWVNAGAPTAATVTNPAAIGKAAANGAIDKVRRGLSQPQTGSSTANYRAHPSGSAAAVAR